MVQLNDVKLFCNEQKYQPYILGMLVNYASVKHSVGNGH